MGIMLVLLFWTQYQGNPGLALSSQGQSAPAPSLCQKQQLHLQNAPPLHR